MNVNGVYMATEYVEMYEPLPPSDTNETDDYYRYGTVPCHWWAGKTVVMAHLRIEFSDGSDGVVMRVCAMVVNGTKGDPPSGMYEGMVTTDEAMAVVADQRFKTNMPAVVLWLREAEAALTTDDLGTSATTYYSRRLRNLGQGEIIISWRRKLMVYGPGALGAVRMNRVLTTLYQMSAQFFKPMVRGLKEERKRYEEFRRMAMMRESRLAGDNRKLLNKLHVITKFPRQDDNRFSTMLNTTKQKQETVQNDLSQIKAEKSYDREQPSGGEPSGGEPSDGCTAYGRKRQWQDGHGMPGKRTTDDGPSTSAKPVAARDPGGVSELKLEYQNPFDAPTQIDEPMTENLLLQEPSTSTSTVTATAADGRQQ